jgi:type VI secretion system secreted protein VgrG
MADYKQSGRFLYLETPMGADQIILRGFNGHEAINQLFEYHLECIVDNKITFDFTKLMGQKINFGIMGEDGQKARDFHGIVITAAQGARDRFFTEHHLTVVPQLWTLTQMYRSRIFQHITIPDVIKQVLQGLDVQYEIQGQWEQREYCVQYQETDFDFFSRLCEEEGIFFFFRYIKGNHKLIVGNTKSSHPDIPGDPKLIFEGVQGGVREEDRISMWTREQNWGSGKYTLWDHHFQLPHRKLDAQQLVVESVTAGKVTHKLKIAGNENLEIYENPGRYAQRFDGIDKAGGEKSGDLQKIFQDNKRTVGIRTQQGEVPFLRFAGGSNVRQLTPGHKFTMQRHFNADGTYVLTEVSHQAYEGSIRADMDAQTEPETHYTNTFMCIPQEVLYRPPRLTKRPMIMGLQSAVVVGPPGEEIFTDKYGRIKVQFHWDRDGKNNADSSCWLRVGTMWAGQTWGVISLPRINQEVIVTFLEGDPDRPMVVGSVYNPDQMPPYELPKHKTVATWRSRSSKSGSRTTFHEIRMEDQKDKEQLFIHSERDLDTRNKRESREWVGKNRHRIVKASQYERVDGNKHTSVGGDRVYLVEGDKHVKTKKNHYEKVEGNSEYTLHGNEIQMVAGSSSKQTFGDVQHKTGRKQALEAGTEVHIKAGQKVIIEAGVQVTLKGAGGFVDVGPMGVTIQGTMVLINSGGMAGAGSGSYPSSPQTQVQEPTTPDTADDGTKFDKL